MIEENVVQLPTLLERLADRIRVLLSREAANREEWIAIQEDKCLTLTAARGQFKADIEFGKWCEDNRFGTDVLNHQDRAAAIAMGREPQALRECLEATERRSLRHIYESEFGRFTRLGKPTRRKGQLSFKQPPTPKLQKALDAYDTLDGDSTPITQRAVSEAAGVSVPTATKAILLRRAESDVAPLDPSAMRATMRKRYEATVRAAKKAMRDEITAEITAEICKEYNAYLARLHERETWAEKIIAGYSGLISRDTFRKIKACLHPDHNSFSHAAEALQVFSELERILVKPEEPVPAGPPLPTTAAELMARRRQQRR